MKNCSPSQANANIANFYMQDNCNCKCHYPEDCEINKNQLLCQNIHAIHSNTPCHSHSPSSDRINVSKHQKKQIQNLQKNISSGCLCVCETIYDCPCHCSSCVCCPCGKERTQENKNSENYYKNLYNKIKSELELEKRRNDQMKYDKLMNKNNLQNFEK